MQVEPLKTNGSQDIIDKTCQLLYDGLRSLFEEKGIACTLSINKSAFSPFFCDELPKDLRDVLENHYFEFDTRYRLELIKWGVYHIPIPCKQDSVSYSHTEDDINRTLEITREV